MEKWYKGRGLDRQRKEKYIILLTSDVNTDSMTKVLVFGTFDGLHPGHLSFLRQAKEHGDFLVVAVGRDEIIQKLKGKPPTYPLEQRIALLQNTDFVDRAITGDEVLGVYTVIAEEKPDIICLGYDQKALGENLEMWLKKNNMDIPIKYMRPHEPEVYHTSLLTK